MDPVAPKFNAKAMLVAGRVVHEPFETPMKMTQSALVVSGVTHNLLGAVNESFIKSFEALGARGPAKLATSLLGRVSATIPASTDQAKKATEVFWTPFSNSMHDVGFSMSNPFAAFYAQRAGFPAPGSSEELQQTLKDIIDSPTGERWPAPPPPAEEEPAPTPSPPAGEKPAPTPGDGGGDKKPPPAGEKPAPTPPPPGDGGGDKKPPPTDDGDDKTPTKGDGSPPPQTATAS